MSKIINFDKFVKSYTNNTCDIITIEDDMVRNDEYLYLSLINAIDKAGYEVSPAGILNYQKDHNLLQTSKISYGDFLVIIQELGNDNVQEIYNYINRKREINTLLSIQSNIDVKNDTPYGYNYSGRFIKNMIFLMIGMLVFVMTIIKIRG